MAVPSPEVDRKFWGAHFTRFFAVPFKDRIPELRVLYPEFGSTFVCDTEPRLRQVGAYFLALQAHLYGRRKQHRFLYTYQLVDLYLKTPIEGQEDPETFYDSHTPFLILYHQANTMQNKQLENMLCHCITERRLEHRVTLYLTEVNTLPRIRTALLGIADPTSPASNAQQPEVI